MGKPNLDPYFYNKQHKIAIYRDYRNRFEAITVTGFEVNSDLMLVHEFKLSIPQSFVECVGAARFKRFCSLAFMLMNKQDCVTPFSVLKPLRRIYRKMKLRLLQYQKSDLHKLLAFFRKAIAELLHNMWLPSRHLRTQIMCENRQKARDNQILGASLLY